SARMRPATHSGQRPEVSRGHFSLGPGPHKIHVGCSHNYLDGWTNIDIDPASKADLLHDISTGLPFPDSSIDVIHSEDFVEHLALSDGKYFFRECFRVLKPGCYMRVLTPDLFKFAHGYVTRDPGTLEWYTEKFGVQTFAEAFNFGMRMGGHTFLYDQETLDRVLSEI